MQIIKEVWVNDITQDRALSFRKKMLFLSQMFPSEDLYVYIDSYGGDVNALFNMLATINQIKNPVITIGMGSAQSCGAVLLSAGDKRYAYKDCEIMIHGVKVFNPPNMNVSELNRFNNDVQNINIKLIDELAANCGKTSEEILRFLARNGGEVVIDPKKAKKLGMIDEIGLPELKAVIYERG